MRLWFWRSLLALLGRPSLLRRNPRPLPAWASNLSPEQRKVLAENLRAIVEPKKVIERSLRSRPLERSAPLR